MSTQAVDLVLGTPVHTTDGIVGRLERVIIDPHQGRTTHLVVRETQLPNTLRLVGEKYLAHADAQGLTLSLTTKHFAACKEYIQTEYFSPDYFLTLAREEHCRLPLAPSSWTLERPATPDGAVALLGHETVEATDGKVGKVDAVLADRATGRVTHLVLRQGHLWGAREVQVPAGLVARFEDGRVILSVDKAAVGALPDVHAA